MRQVYKIQENGRVTLPREWREKYGLKKGDVVSFVEIEQGLVVVPRMVIAMEALGEIGKALKDKGATLEVSTGKPDVPVYQLKITLKDSKPPIWRRLLVPGDTTLARLHRIIQEAMGWWDYHLHQFIVGGVYYGEPSPDDWHEVNDERRIRLSQIAPSEKSRFVYEYDFGDDWIHTVQVEKVLPPNPEQKLPVCVKGKRACPPEDVGGIWGYDSFLEAISDPNHEEHASYLEWIGGSFDPEAFDVDEANARLQKLR